MKRAFVVCVMIVVALATAAAAQQGPNWDIACRGTESNGGGLQQYEYELLNISGGPLVLTNLHVTTNDMNWNNYANWTMPANWNSALLPVGGWSNVLKTPHGQIAPPPGGGGAGWIRWSAPAGAGVLVPPNGTALFGFDNPHESWNVDWFATPEVPNAVGANWNLPVAGPAGVFTHGPVHAPVPEPSALLLFSAAVAILAAWSWSRARGR